MRYENTMGVYEPDTSKLAASRSDAMPESVPDAADSTSTGRKERARCQGRGLLALPLKMPYRRVSLRTVGVLASA